MALINTAQHACHTFFFILFIIGFVIISGRLISDQSKSDINNSIAEYGLTGAALLYIIRSLPLVQLPYCVLNMIGLILYNCFPGRVILKYPISSAPFICFRIVTRGDCPQMVIETVTKNLSMFQSWPTEVCHGDCHSEFQKSFSIPAEPHVQQLLVPDSYRTKSGAMYKSRSLHYCLENDVNKLHPDDWIVHLDEDTFMTEDSVRGVINFCTDGTHPFGQGAIISFPDKSANWLTAFFNSHRVAENFGRLRLQYHWFQRAVLGFQGPYLVARAREEMDVGFDNGLAGSLCDDTTMAMLTCHQGYTSGFIEGVMYEMPPLTIKDHLLQRRRWFRAFYAAITNKAIPLNLRAPHYLTFLWWVVTPAYLVNIWLPHYSPHHWLLDFLLSLTDAVNIYMYFFGAVKQFSTCFSFFATIIPCAICVGFVMIINLHIETIVIISGLFAILMNDNQWSVTPKNFEGYRDDKKLP